MSDKTSLIKILRDKTGAGFLDCKNALAENNNEIEASVDHLRKKGLAKASKKSSRTASEGAVGIYSNESKSIIIKINSETDFASKGDTFLKFFDQIGNFLLECNDNLDLKTVMDKKFNDKKLSDYFTDIIARIGENILLGDLIVIDHKNINFSYYVHNSYKKNIGKIISYINFDSQQLNDQVNEFSKNLCMHIAASKPEALDIEFLDNDLIKREKEIQLASIESSGKPKDIIEKILEGKMKKFYSESTLLNQKYVLDPEKTVKEAINELPKDLEYKLISYELLILNQ